jgi:dipeptidyl aminopeptidase/acylaminoacyl peptidase
MRPLISSYCVSGVLLVMPYSGSCLGADRPLHRYLETLPSPDGQYVADVEGDAPPSGREPIIRDLIVRRVDTGAATTVVLPCGHVPECWPSSLIWAPQGQKLTFALRVPGSHARSVYSVAPDGGQLTELLSFNGTINSLHYGSDGRLAMLATEAALKETGATQAGASISQSQPDAAPTDLHEQRIAVLDGGQLQWVSPRDLFVYEYDWLPNGQGFVGTAAPGDGDSHWWSAKLFAFGMSPATARVLYAPRDARQQLAEPRVSPDGRSVAFIGGLMSDFGSTGGDVFVIPAVGGTAVNLTHGQHSSAMSLGFDCHGALLVKRLRADVSEIEQFDLTPSAAMVRTLWSGSASLYGRQGGISFSCPSELTSTVREDFTTPPEILVGPINAWRALTDANDGMSVTTSVRSIQWTNNGFDLQGWLVMPAGMNHKLPMITVVHGGPASASIPSFIGTGTWHALLDQGYALFFPNPRGSFGQGETFTLANVRDFGYGDLRDILAGIDAIQHSAPIDAARLGIMGGSYGGYMTMWTVTQTHLFKAAVAQAGVSDWLSYYGENGIDQWLLPYFGASVYDDPAVYARSSPINFIRNVRTPTFEFVGELDIECPSPQTQEFWHALHERGIPTSMVIYPQEGHGLRDPSHLEDAQRRVLAWFNRYLQP